jgi:TIR domain
VAQIFLSHSHLDQDFAITLTNGLQGHGLEVWIDRQDLQAGDAWRAAISHAISECSAFLVVLSPNCVASNNVVKELSIAESKNRHIVPIMYQTCEIPDAMEYQLAGLQWINFSEMGFDNALERLVTVLAKGKPAQPGKPGFAQTAPRTPSIPFPSPPVPQPVSQPQDLARILCGRWNVQIGSAYVGAVGQLVIDLYPNGAFNGQLMTPAGPSAVAGQWMVTPVGQLMLQGQQTMGWAVGPYAALVQFSQVTPALLTGTSAAGEQLTCTRIA